MIRKLALVIVAAMLVPACGSGPKKSPFAADYAAVYKYYAQAKDCDAKCDYKGALDALSECETKAGALLTRIPAGDENAGKTRKLIDAAKSLRPGVEGRMRDDEKERQKVVASAKGAGGGVQSEGDFWGDAAKNTTADGGKIDPELAAKQKAEAEKKASDEARSAAEKADTAVRSRESTSRDKPEADENAEERKDEASKKVAAVAAKSDPLGKPDLPVVEINDKTPPLQTVKICKKGNAVAAYVLLVNKTDKVWRVGSVTGDFLDAGANFVDRVIMTYEADNFTPKWESILESDGKTVTAESLEMKPKTKRMIVVVTDSKDAGRVSKIRLAIPTTTNEYFEGPD